MADHIFRLGVLSDTHGDVFSIREAAQVMGEIDALAFLGDCVTDIGFIAQVFRVPMYSVRGNCDFFASEPVETVIELEGKRLLLTHGHNYNVKLTYQLLMYRALELRCDAALFGHTHQAYASYDGGVLMFNPGSVAAHRATCGVLEFRPNGLSPRVYDI